MRLAMKFGVSLASTTPFPSRLIAKIRQGGEHYLGSLGTAQSLHQFHIARWIEKVRARPVLLKFFRHSFRDQ